MNRASQVARSPAKLILSGEHSVLYQQPAIAIAVNRYTTVTTNWQPDSSIIFRFLDLKYAKAQSLQALAKLRLRLQDNYYSFLEGSCTIKDVLKRPFELLQYCVTNLIDKLGIHLPRGIEIKVDSDIPIGCGMGSSAAAVISILHALNQLFNLNLTAGHYLSLARDVENLQHGKSSGLDIQLATYGGCKLYNNGEVYNREIPNFKLQIVNTGKPQTSTGECVAKVGTLLSSGSLATDFGAVTKAMDQALQQNNFTDFKLAIHENHKLLDKLGVVPDKVANFVQEVEQCGGAAKICGAGAIAGDNAGVVLVIGDEIQPVLNKYGYQISEVVIDQHGTKII